MNQNNKTALTLADFGTAELRVERAVAQIRAGGGVIVVDDEDRENEGDIIYAAETISPQQMNLLIRAGSGIVCLVLTEERTRVLDLPPMVTQNTGRYGTPFTVSVEAKVGVTTGVSAADRVTTIRTAIADGCQPSDLARPGHVFPLKAHPAGVLGRRGHTEGTIELMRLADVKPAGVLCEVMNEDGTMARLPELMEFARLHAMPVVTIEDLVAYVEQRAAA